MNASISTDRNWSLTGTILFHCLLLAMLSLVKCDSFSPPKEDGGGGGGGNNGFLSMDAAGVGSVVDGVYEPDPEPVQEQEEPNPIDDYAEEVIDDGSSSHAIIDNKGKKPVNPEETPEQRRQRIEQERIEQERIDRQNRLSGGLSGDGGSSGNGGGSGGGNGGGNGPGNGDGNGDGNGGGSGGGNGRGIKYMPDCGSGAEEKGWVKVRIVLNADGTVANAKATDNSSFSNVSKHRKMAESCAMNYRFSSGKAGDPITIKVEFKPR
jgi:hypothetical protein